jgi:hypothetical protein
MKRLVHGVETPPKRARPPNSVLMESGSIHHYRAIRLVPRLNDPEGQG